MPPLDRPEHRRPLLQGEAKSTRQAVPVDEAAAELGLEKRVVAPLVLDLLRDLEATLELIAQGGIPSPERGAELLRRLRLATRENGQTRSPRRN